MSDMGLNGKWLATVLVIVAMVCATAIAQNSTAKAPSTHKASAKSRPASHTTKSSTAKVKHTSSKKSRKSRRSRRGQQVIDSSRAREIQQALIREHYLDGQASGKWDERTQAAMRKYQADNGWQSKTVPDSRALIKLGLGPSKDGLLNPETAMTSPLDHPAADAKAAEPTPTGKGDPRE